MGGHRDFLSRRLTLFPAHSFCNGTAMAEVINLRLARKARARNDAARQAAQNRAVHGQGRADRQLHKLEEARQNRQIDAHLRDKD